LKFHEIAQRLGISERSIRRVINAIQKRMEAQKWR
jgi:DNA-binding NarL/FixJ family response regulator